MKHIDDYITSDAQQMLRDEISQADGNEVFFLGVTDQQKKVCSVKALARGNRSQVSIRSDVVEWGNIIIHNHPGGPLTPSDEDIELFSFFSNFGVGAFIVDNRVSGIYVAVEPFERCEKKELIADEIENVFIHGGTIHKILPTYEYRSEQLLMAQEVRHRFNREGISLIEAGTGTGKTFAYLVPAILYAVSNNERVVISTNTINLQEQILSKDIPLLQRVLPCEVKARIVKGRANYLCRRKLEDTADHGLLLTSEDELRAINELRAWSATTKDGSLSDLGFLPDEGLWEKVRSEGDSCARVKCPFYKSCFYYRARREASSANIIIVNHHLLFADISIRQHVGDYSDHVILPPYKGIIIDEAHNIEDAATSYFSKRIGRYSVTRVLNRLYGKKGNRKATGIFPLLKNQYKGEKKLENLIKRLQHDIGEVKTYSNATFDACNEFFSFHFKGKSASEPFITLTKEIVYSLEYKDYIFDNLIQLKSMLEKLADEIRILVGIIEKLNASECAKGKNVAVDVISVLSKLLDIAAGITSFTQAEEANLVRWIETRRKGTAIETYFNCAPIEIKEVLKNCLFQEGKIIVLTSATLTVEGHLQFIKQRLGINDIYERFTKDSYSELVLPSSFDYKKQVMVGVFEHLPFPTAPGFADQLAQTIFKALTVTQGKAFVLFTSYELLNTVARKLENPLLLAGIPVYKQGSGNRYTILDHFKKDMHSVLFGTDSFWEGVDVEGETLSNVLITRLPFNVPKDPVIEARIAAIKRDGGNSFLDYLVPQAVIKFKQGFGRLIRRKTDYGSVLIFDSRLIHKSYGMKFLNSLPNCTVMCGDEEMIFENIRDFIQMHQREHDEISLTKSE